MGDGDSLLIVHRRGGGLAEAVAAACAVAWLPRCYHLEAMSAALPVATGDADALCLVLAAIDEPDTLRAMWRAAFSSGVARGARLVLLAPQAPAAGALNSALVQVAQHAREHGLQPVELRYGLVFADLLLARENLGSRRQLALPMAGRSPRWCAGPEVASRVVDALSRPASALVEPQHGTAYSGRVLAAAFSAALKRNLVGECFLRRAFNVVDANADGRVDRDELAVYLSGFGFGDAVVDEVLRGADRRGDGSIDFDEFCHSFGGQMDALLEPVSRQVNYLPLTPMAFSCELSLQGVSDAAIAQLLYLFEADEEGLAAAELSRQPLDQWLDEHIMQFLKIHLVPGKGLLTLHRGFYASRAARIIDLVSPGGAVIKGYRSLDNKLVHFFRTDLPDHEVEKLRFAHESGQRELSVHDERLVGFESRGHWRSLGMAMSLLLEGGVLAPAQRALFQDRGELHPAQLPVDADHDEMLCTCTGATRGELRMLIGEGHRTLQSLADEAMVTEICGACERDVVDLLRAEGCLPDGRPTGHRSQ